MIISPGRGYIFVHIPKTGGTAMALALEARAMKDDILIGDTPKALRRRRRLAALTPAGRLWKHSTLADIDGVLPPDQIAAMQVVTLVRNPWDRLVSYYHWLRAQTFAHPAVDLAGRLSFADFLRDPSTQASIAAHPFTHYITDVTGRCHDAHMIRLEHFDQDAAPFAAQLGVPLVLPRANASARDRDFRRYYTDDTAAIVARICAADIARFGYRFEGANN